MVTGLTVSLKAVLYMFLQEATNKANGSFVLFLEVERFASFLTEWLMFIKPLRYGTNIKTNISIEYLVQGE